MKLRSACITFFIRLHEAQLFARACGKTNLHSLEPEDLAALTMEASAMAAVPLAGTNHTVGVADYHHL